jgi:hypothetical protein
MLYYCSVFSGQELASWAPEAAFLCHGTRLKNETTEGTRMKKHAKTSTSDMSNTVFNKKYRDVSMNDNDHHLAVAYRHNDQKSFA